MICTNCKYEINEDANFCFNCGVKVERINLCNKCGKELISGAKFCSNCGHAVSNINSGRTIEDEHIDETVNVVKWYRKYFEYIGEFQDGYAPVIDNLSNTQLVGYVPINIPNELISREKSDNNFDTRTILNYYKINEYIVDRMTWVGEFCNGKALISNNGSIYTVDIDGKYKKGGELRYDTKFKYDECVIAWNNGLYDEKLETEHFCVINFKGNLLRNNHEKIKRIGNLNFATYTLLDSYPAQHGLLNLTNGEQILEAKYDDLEYAYKVFPDSTILCAIITCMIDLKGNRSFGCINPFKGRLFEDKYSYIDLARDKEGYWNGHIIICLSEENVDSKTVFQMAVADATGEIMFQYTSSEKQYKVINGKTFVFIYNGHGIEVVRVDEENHLVLSCQNAIELEYIGENHFVVINEKGQYGIMDINSKFAIPFGAFDEIGSLINDGGIKACKNNLWGFVDITGKVLIPLMYSSIRDEYSKSDSIFVRPNDGRIGLYINYRNEILEEIPNK